MKTLYGLLLTLIVVFSTSRLAGDTVTVVCDDFQTFSYPDVYTVSDSCEWVIMQTKDNGKKMFLKSKIINIDYPKDKGKLK